MNFYKVYLTFRQQFIDYLKSYIKHKKECFIWYPHTLVEVGLITFRCLNND